MRLDKLDPPVDLDHDHVLGPPDAELTLVEYGSYACLIVTLFTRSSLDCGAGLGSGCATCFATSPWLEARTHYGRLS